MATTTPLRKILLMLLRRQAAWSFSATTKASQICFNPKSEKKVTNLAVDKDKEYR